MLGGKETRWHIFALGLPFQYLVCACASSSNLCILAGRGGRVGGGDLVAVVGEGVVSLVHTPVRIVRAHGLIGASA